MVTGKKYDLDLKKIEIVHNGLDLEPKEAISKSDNSEIVVLANFLKYKGQESLINCLAKIDLDFRITFIGDGPELQKCQELIIDLKMERKVRFLSTSDPKVILRECSFAIHPSFTEGLSNAILEEMACGLPVIAYNTGGNSELIVDNVNGYLVEIGNQELFENRIRTLIEHPEKRRLMGLKAFEKASEFSWQKSVEAHLKIFEKFAY